MIRLEEVELDLTTEQAEAIFRAIRQGDGLRLRRLGVMHLYCLERVTPEIMSQAMVRL